MWVRNIVWFILLIGIVMFSLLLFLLIMNPTTGYQGLEQTVGQEKESKEGGGHSGDTKSDDGAHAPQATEEHQAPAAKDSHSGSAASTDSHGAESGTHTSPAAKQEAPQQHSEQKSPPTAHAGDDSTVPFSYVVGIGTGYFALICTFVPYGLFMLAGRLARSRTQALPFFMLFSVAAVSLHGGIMLRVVQDWDRKLLAGIGVFICLLLFYMRASLYTPGIRRRVNSFSILIVIILLLFIIHAVG